MLHPQSEHLRHIVTPLLHGLRREGIHEVNRDIIKARVLRRANCVACLRSCVPSPYHTQQIIIETLYTNTQSIESHLAPRTGFLRRDISRIGLQSELNITDFIGGWCSVV